LSHIDKQGVSVALERLRCGFAEEQFAFAPSLRVTASFGVAGLQNGGPTDLEQLLSQADAALYRAKQQGRNRFEFTENVPPASPASPEISLSQG